MSESRDRSLPERGDDARPPMPPAKARQGVIGHNVRYVLGFGIAGAVIALALVYAVFFAG
jgi:hypothetical protein